MALARTQHWIITPPRSIKKKTFLAIVDQLPRVASYFPATDWNVRAEFAREGSREKAQGIKEVQALALSLLETATVSAFNLYLLLNGEGGRSCELRLSITGQKNELSISDVGTGWGKSLRDRAKRELKRYRVLTIWSRHGTRIIMRNFDHLFAVLASSIFILSYSDFQVTYRELLLGSAFAAPSGD